MSKMDNLRAMREARYEAAAARAGKATATRVRPPVAPPGPAAAEPSAAPAADGDLCGHRNMSGRTCTRERGHSAKSHRYS
jgi:hypothetical protein